MPAPATARPLPAAGGTVKWLLQRHALKLHHEVRDGRQQAGGGRGCSRGYVFPIVSPVSRGGGAHAVFADDARRKEAILTAAQQVLFCCRLNQVCPTVVQRDGKDVPTHCSFQAFLGCNRGSDAGECCILPVLHFLEANVIALIQESTNRDGVAEFFGLT